MSDQTQYSSLLDFITHNFTLPDNDTGVNYLLGLPIEEKNGKMIGTKNNLSRSELLDFHKNGWVQLSNGQVYNLNIKSPTHFELRLRFTSNIVCIDVDGITENGDCKVNDILDMDVIKKNFDGCSYTLSRNKRLPHFYFKLEGIDLSQHKGTFVDSFIDFKGDLLINHAWEKIHDNPIYNYTDELQTYYYDDIKDIFKPNIFDKNIRNPVSQKFGNDGVLCEIIELISLDFLQNYESWSRIIWACKNCGINEEFARNISKKASNYSDDGFDNVWTSTYTSLTEGTIRHYARLSNEVEYKKLSISIDYDDQFVIPDGIMSISKLISLSSTTTIPPPYKANKSLSRDANAEAEATHKIERSNAIEEAFNETLHLKKEYFEKFHIKILSPTGFVRIVDRKINLTSVKDLENQYENVLIPKEIRGDPKLLRFTEQWRKLPSIKTFNTIDFAPPPLFCPEHTLNTFTGLRGELLPETENVDISIWENHLMMLVGNDKNGYTYALKYFAHMIQKPGESPRTAIVFNSDSQGVGKNLFLEAFGTMLLGKDYMLVTENMDDVLGRFNQSQNKIMIIMDEVKSKDAYSNMERIKSRITTSAISWESKGINSVTINYCARHFMLGNSITFPIEFQDRRYNVFDCDNSRANDPTYMNPLVGFLKDVLCMKAVYKMLKNTDISNWNPTTDRVQTTIYKDLQNANKPTMAVFLEERLMGYEHSTLYPDEESDNIWNNIPSKELFTTYKQWLISSGFTALSDKINTTNFALQLKKYDGINKVKARASNNYSFDYELLKSSLIKKGYME